METKPLTKREQRRVAKIVKKGLDAAFLEIAKDRCRRASQKPPADLAGWGVTKTRAWLKLAQLAVRRLKAQRVKAEELEHLTSRLADIKAWSIEQCQEFINEKPAAKQH